MTEITNSHRAKMAKAAIDVFWQHNSDNPNAETEETKACDLVASVVHFLRLRCDLSFVDAASKIAAAVGMARVEMEEDKDFLDDREQRARPDEPDTSGTEMRQYTGFCQETSGQGTVWIGHVDAHNEDEARGILRENCAADWEYETKDVHVLGIAEGNVNILEWTDLNDD